MDLDLTGKHALVCGGSQGIGRAAAIELARLGADVTVLARSREALESTVAELPRAHAAQRHGLVAVDMRNRALLRGQVAAIANATPVVILVNNTGGPPGGPAHTAGESDYLAAFEQHLLANQALVETVLPGMQRTGYGRIVNVISTSVKEPIPNLGVSNTIRGAVAAWAKTPCDRARAFGHHRQQRAARLHANAATRPDPSRPRGGERQARGRNRAHDARDGAARTLCASRRDRMRHRVPRLACGRVRQRHQRSRGRRPQARRGTR